MDPGSPGVVLGLSVLAFEALVSMFLIIFIISVILRHYHERKRLDTKDQIDMALNVSCTILIIVVTYSEFSNILQPDLTRRSNPSPLCAVFIVYSMCSSSWLVALVFFFYFIKIVHVKWVFISWVKMRISSIVPGQILLVELMSLSISLLHLLPYRAAHVSSTNSSCISSPSTTLGQRIIHDYVSLLLVVMIFTPVLLSLVTIVPTAAFLRCHVTKMKDTNTSSEVHQYNRAVRKWLCFLLLYSILHVVVFFYYFSFFALYGAGYWINLILLISFILALYILKIFETPYWRTTWKEMISYFTCYREPSTC